MVFHLILGCLAGFLAGKVMRGEGYGFIVDILLGLAGGWVGSWVLGLLGLHIPVWSYFITAFLGAVLLVWIVRLVKGD
ncbi:GlsB/YeaQ/YmgE family stress response membrane protein [Mucilaginibacter sp. SP1R1]|uniref:GlsB/YeaQ/YmgE family stress response membrane protein n=1 Tax=Mucilaginibacter sp. SP1R1 TaxID=2723091 RepID=UPI0017DEFE48|nr:GlsB/YeaQ/YmgE family stress response membrane protein [Mucilaginibacter sp. SP1R1]MBB6152722.1 putative membrane protein YeaQ/YmgE (transglycosylase-associated protein family) [Mucilaginibacter sp. SP1R1]